MAQQQQQPEIATPVIDKLDLSSSLSSVAATPSQSFMKLSSSSSAQNTENQKNGVPLRVETRFRPISFGGSTINLGSCSSSSFSSSYSSSSSSVAKMDPLSSLSSPVARLQLKSPIPQTAPVVLTEQSQSVQPGYQPVHPRSLLRKAYSTSAFTRAPVSVGSVVQPSVEASAALAAELKPAKALLRSHSDSSLSTSTSTSSISAAFVVALQPFVPKPMSFSTAHTTMPPLNRSESPILRKRRSIHSMFEEKDTTARDGFETATRTRTDNSRASSSDSTDDELLRAAQIGSRGTSRRRMRLVSRSFNNDQSSASASQEDTRMIMTGNDAAESDDESSSNHNGQQPVVSRSMSSVDLCLMRRSDAPLRRSSSSMSTTRVGAYSSTSRPMRVRSRRRDGSRSMSNTPRGSPTPEDAECAAIIQAVMHQVNESTRINPSPPPEDLDRCSGNMLSTVQRPKIPDLKCIDASTLCSLLVDGWKEKFSRFLVVDCRFDYEYDGGHIRSAVHCSEPKDVITQFFKQPPEEGALPVCLVFHCEFSKNRAPKM